MPKPTSFPQIKGQYSFIAGLDEAGRGPLAGPVIAAAVGFDFKNKETETKKLAEIGVKDSKQISANKREKMFATLMQEFPIGIGMADVSTIDSINILQATFLAMKRALTNLKRYAGEQPEFLILDGNQTIPNLSLRQKAIPKADEFVPLVSAASIIAKVTRDQLIIKLAKKYPAYGFERHKGYGTKEHMAALARHGPCPIHRRSFRPVKRALEINKT